MAAWEELGEEEQQELAGLFTGRLHHLVRRASDGVALPRTLLPILPTIRAFQVREDDVFVVSFPKCGTTLTMELCWLVTHGADLAQAQEARGDRCAFLEGPGMLGGEEWEEFYTSLSSAPSPRVFNSHLPLDLLPRDLLKARVVWVGRGVQDCCVSYYHHNRLLKHHSYTGDFQTFARLFRGARVPYGDYWAQLGSMWGLRGHPRVRMVWYEDIVRDRPAAIRSLAEFLACQLSEEQVEQVAAFLQVDTYRQKCQLNNRANWNPGEGNFVRKGVVGDSVTYFGEESGDWEDWATEKLAKIGVQEQKVLDYFKRIK